MRTDEEREIQREFARFKRLAFHDEWLAGQKQWRDDNPDKCHAYNKRRWEKDKEGEYSRTRAWISTRPEKQRAYSKKQREKDPEKLKEAKREEYRQNADAYIRRSCAWSKNNPVKMKQYAFNRKAWKLSNGTENCEAKITLLQSERFCHWCCRPLTKNNLSIDHVIPLKRGGGHIPDNLVAACRSCNCSKNDRLVSEWKWKMYEEIN